MVGNINEFGLILLGNVPGIKKIAVGHSHVLMYLSDGDLRVFGGK